MKNSWTFHEQFINKSWASYEQFKTIYLQLFYLSLNSTCSQFLSNLFMSIYSFFHRMTWTHEVMKNSLTSHGQDMNKLWRSHGQVKTIISDEWLYGVHSFFYKNQLNWVEFQLFLVFWHLNIFQGFLIFCGNEPQSSY